MALWRTASATRSRSVSAGGGGGAPGSHPAPPSPTSPGSGAGGACIRQPAVIINSSINSRRAAPSSLTRLSSPSTLPRLRPRAYDAGDRVSRSPAVDPLLPPVATAGVGGDENVRELLGELEERVFDAGAAIAAARHRDAGVDVDATILR